MVEKSERVPEIGQEVRYWRKLRKMTLEQLGRQSDSNPTNLAKLERGEAGLSLARFEKVAKALNVPLSLLIDPNAPYVVKQGEITGPGKWVAQKPIVEDADVVPVLMPSPTLAVTAFRSGENWLFCDHRQSDALLRSRYVVLREFMIEDQLRYELAVRRFVRDVSAEIQNEARSAPTDAASSSAIKTAELLRRAFAEGWFALEGDPPDELRFYHQIVPRDDPSIVRRWPLIATLQYIS